MFFKLFFNSIYCLMPVVFLVQVNTKSLRFFSDGPDYAVTNFSCNGSSFLNKSLYLDGEQVVSMSCYGNGYPLPNCSWTSCVYSNCSHIVGCNIHSSITADANVTCTANNVLKHISNTTSIIVVPSSSKYLPKYFAINSKCGAYYFIYF